MTRKKVKAKPLTREQEFFVIQQALAGISRAIKENTEVNKKVLEVVKAIKPYQSADLFKTPVQPNTPFQPQCPRWKETFGVSTSKDFSFIVDDLDLALLDDRLVEILEGGE